jgi:DNA-binding phage protein
MPTVKTNAYDRFVAEKMRKPAFAAAYAKERAEIDAIDAVIRTIEEARVQTGISKAELARRIAASPESVRRLLTAQRVNPTFLTVLRILPVVGLKLALVSDPQPRVAARSAAPRRKNATRVAITA